MAKVTCPHHRDKKMFPVMIHFGENSLGKQYICSVCSGVRVFNTGKIVSLNKNYGFIGGQKNNFFFHFNNFTHGLVPFKGMMVSFEVSFLEDNKIQAINVKPFKEK